MKREVENWLKIARYDLKTARVAYKNKLYLKVIENCHSATEKILKGLILSKKKRKPPKIHNLMILAGEALLGNLKNEIKIAFDELNDIYILTRYPDDFDSMIADLSEQRAYKILKKIGGIFKWLEKQIMQI